MPASPHLIMGPVIGRYEDKPIYEYIIADGYRYTYNGLALKDKDNSIPLSQLRSNEWILAPGLLYSPDSKDLRIC